METKHSESASESPAAQVSAVPTPTATASFGGMRICNCGGIWLHEGTVSSLTEIQSKLVPRPTDIFLTSFPKCGTTWLKALTFAVTARKDHPPADPNHPLLSASPRDFCPLTELFIARGRSSDLEALPSPRLLASHLPYQLLPNSVTSSSECRIVYIIREPKDVLVSRWHFAHNIRNLDSDTFPLSEAFEMFCMGIVPFGPVWDHMLGYWNESLRRPSKVLFLKYEDMKRDGVTNLKRLAEFIGCPFSQEEESAGVTEQILSLCSFEKLSALEVNTKGKNFRVRDFGVIDNSAFFRKGQIGDWGNHLSVEMARKLDAITKEKLQGSGLCFSTTEESGDTSQ